MQNRITNLYDCPECGTPTNGRSCRCGWAKPKKVVPNSTAYVAKPPMTAEETARSRKAAAQTFQQLVKEHPAMFAGKRWDKYRETKQEEAENA